MGARVVHQNQSARVNLRQKSPYLLLANRQMAVAKQNINRPVNRRLQARSIPILDPIPEARSVNALFCLCKNRGIKLNRDQFSKSVGLQSLRHLDRAVPDKRPGLYDQSRFCRNHDGLQKIQYLQLRALRIHHLPPFRMRALWRRPYVLRLNEIRLLANAIQNVMPFVALDESRNNHTDHSAAGRNRDDASRKRNAAVRDVCSRAEQRCFKPQVGARKYQPFAKHDSCRPLKLQLAPPFTPEEGRQQASSCNSPSRRRIE